MSENCGLVTRKARCRCRLKVTELIRLGYRNPEKLIYKNLPFDHQIKEMVAGRVKVFLNTHFHTFNSVFQNQPFWRAPDMKNWLSSMIEGDCSSPVLETAPGLFDSRRASFIEVMRGRLFLEPRLPEACTAHPRVRPPR
jgi:hypothetical protein